MKDFVTLAQGGGGTESKKLVDMITSFIGNDVLAPFDDAGVFGVEKGRLAFTTDGFVVKPIFFPGGNIGRLAACGTLNDLAVMAARPIAVSLSLVIEEGFPLEKLVQIMENFKTDLGGTKVVCGDTKVVEKGSVDGVFMTTSGIGLQMDNCHPSGSSLEPGDVLIVTGSLGRHGACIMACRDELGFFGQIQSDVAPLWPMLEKLFVGIGENIHACRDITRGGFSAIVNEFAQSSRVGIDIDEALLPIDPDVSGMCGALGLDPLTLACEGRALVSVRKGFEEKALEILEGSEQGSGACIVGSVSETHSQLVHLKTRIGGARVLDPPAGELLPRIC